MVLACGSCRDKTNTDHALLFHNVRAFLRDVTTPLSTVYSSIYVEKVVKEHIVGSTLILYIDISKTTADRIFFVVNKFSLVYPMTMKI